METCTPIARNTTTSYSMGRTLETPAGRIVPHPGERFSVVSFFAGCGGLDLGLAGGFGYKNLFLAPNPFEVVAAYDNDERCVETYTINIGAHARKADLGNSDPKDMPKADILIGGFPCQDFSSCGPKKGLSSKRGRLYKTLISYVKTHRPKLVLAENVPHLARMGGGMVLDKIMADFRETGYRFEIWNLFAPDYGVPQSRTRLFFVGVRDDISGEPVKPRPTHEATPRTIDWAIGDLVRVTDESVPNQGQYFKASKAKRGNGQGDETTVSGRPSYTIRANAKSRVQFHYKLPRRLTVRECARLQTFPDSFSFPHSATTNIMQIGNAVPPLLAHHVGRSLSEFLKTVAAEDGA